MKAIRVCRADMTGLRGTTWPSSGRFEAIPRKDGRPGALYALVWLGLGRPVADYVVESFDAGMRRPRRARPPGRSYDENGMLIVPSIEPRWLVLDVELSEGNYLGTAGNCGGGHGTGWREISFKACEVVAVTDLAGAVAASAGPIEERLALALNYAPSSLGFNPTVGRSYYRLASGVVIDGDPGER